MYHSTGQRWFQLEVEKLWFLLQQRSACQKRGHHVRQWDLCWKAKNRQVRDQRGCYLSRIADVGPINHNYRVLRSRNWCLYVWLNVGGHLENPNSGSTKFWQKSVQMVLKAIAWSLFDSINYYQSQYKNVLISIKQAETLV